jgi:tetratricopeptide (TPR) repeat protein
LHEFRGLVLFAKGDYQEAAATVHAVLAVGPGWDWTTLISLYRNPNVYTTQLRALEATVKKNPKEGAIRFLLAYHYLAEGYPDAAARILRRVVDLEPNDRVAKSLLQMVTQPDHSAAEQAPLPTPDAPATDETPISTIDPTQVIGTWMAIRDDGAKFSLKLADDKKFTWTFAAKNVTSRSFEGTYSVVNDVITLESIGQGTLAANLKLTSDDRFNFKAVGAPPQDSGLDFGRTDSE